MSKAANARAKFAELRALRESGKKRLDSYEVHQAADIYEEVDEDGYKKVVRDRLNQDDFVIDDNGEGYADDGREEWDRRLDYGTESDDDLSTKNISSKSGRSQKCKTRPSRTNSICSEEKTRRR
jgi:DNA polymerase alpha subunit A